MSQLLIFTCDKHTHRTQVSKKVKLPYMNIHETLIIEGLLRWYEICEYLLDFVYNQHHDACIDNRQFPRK
jgi:hypothetical protein